jgi:crossover junction endodeoxyribonuclease RusA
MPDVVSFTLPWPPSVNHYYAVVRGRKIMSAAGRSYRTAASMDLFMQHVPAQRAGSRLALRIVAFPPDRRARDLDNLLKPLLDSLTAARIIEDDGMIDDLHIIRGNVTPGGSVSIELWRKGAADR